MLEINLFIGKPNKQIYHMMSKKIKKFLAKVALKVNEEISKIFSIPNDNSILQYGLTQDRLTPTNFRSWPICY